MATAGAPLTAAVVGGGMGGLLSMRGLAASERYHLVAATDLRPEVCRTLRETFPGLRTFSRHQDMLEQCPTDVVCVSTWPPSHEQVTRDALALPGLRGILVEKPLGDTAAAGRRILEAVTARGVPMVVPHGLLVRKVSLEVLQRVRDGEIGELTLVEIQCQDWDIINAGIHWLSFFVTLTGNEPIASVLALCDTSTRTYRDGMQVETVAVTSAQTRDGVRVVMHTGDQIPVNSAGHWTAFRLIGTRGQIEFWGWDPGYRILNAAHPHGELIEPGDFPGTPHQRYLERLAAMIESGEHDYTIPEGSLLALEICEAAYLSSRHRCQVTFPLATFTPPVPGDWDPGAAYSGTGGGRDGRAL